MALADPRVESPMESRLRVLMIQSGLPTPVVQHEVHDDTGCFVARVDLAYPDRRLGIEYDGDHHRDRAVFHHDAERLNRLQLTGWRILRFTAPDLYHHPTRLITRIATALMS